MRRPVLGQQHPPLLLLQLLLLLLLLFRSSGFSLGGSSRLCPCLLNPTEEAQGFLSLSSISQNHGGETEVSQSLLQIAWPSASQQSWPAAAPAASETGANAPNDEVAPTAAATPAATESARPAAATPAATAESAAAATGGVDSAATEPAVESTAAALAAEIEGAFVGVVAAAAAALTASSNSSSSSIAGSRSSTSTSTNISLWLDGAAPAAIETARTSFLSKVSRAFGLKSGKEANGVVYVHRNSSNSAKLLVDRQRLLRLRGQQRKGSWSLHFLGTGAMQASATRGTSCVLFSRGDGSAWLFDCGGGPSPTNAASVSRGDTTTDTAAAAAAAGISSRLRHAVALTVAAESIVRQDAADIQQQQQQTRRRRMGVVQRVFVTHLHGDHCLGIPAFLAQIAEDPEQGPRHVEIVGPEGLRNLLRCILHGTSARRLPSFSVVELRGIPHLHHRRSRAVRVPPMPPAASEAVGRPDIEPNADGSYDVFEDAGIHVRAAPIRHLVPCVGYVVAEKQPRLRLRPDVLDPVIAKNAEQLADVTKWPQLRGTPKAVYRLLSEMAHVETFVFPDGTRVRSSEIFAEAPEPRKFCIAFDTCDASRLIPFSRGADVVVHEATMSGAKGTSSKSNHPTDPLMPLAKCSPSKGGSVRGGSAEKSLSAAELMGSQVQTASAAAFERGHSSAAMAGSFAARIGAPRLLLTHFSQRYRGDAALRSVLTMESVEDEARRAYEIERQLQHLTQPASRLWVTAAWDGLSMVLPQRTSSSTAAVEDVREAGASAAQ